MGLSHTVSDRRLFQSKIAKIFPPLVFCTPAEGVLLGIGYRHWGSKNQNEGATGVEKSMTISTAVWIQCTTMTDRQTDIQTTTNTVLTDSVTR